MVRWSSKWELADELYMRKINSKKKLYMRNIMEIFHVRWFLEKIFHDGKNVKAVKHVEIHNDASKKEDAEFDKITCLVIFLFLSRN